MSVAAIKKRALRGDLVSKKSEEFNVTLNESDGLTSRVAIMSA